MKNSTVFDVRVLCEIVDSCEISFHDYLGTRTLAIVVNCANSQSSIEDYLFKLGASLGRKFPDVNLPSIAIETIGSTAIICFIGITTTLSELIELNATPYKGEILSDSINSLKLSSYPPSSKSILPSIHGILVSKIV